MVTPAGCTSRACTGSHIVLVRTMRVSFGISAQSRTCLSGAEIIGPPGLTLGTVFVAALLPGADAGLTGPPAPATAFPQAASPITRPAAIPPSASRLATPPLLPGVSITDSFLRVRRLVGLAWLAQAGPHSLGRAEARSGSLPAATRPRLSPEQARWPRGGRGPRDRKSVV